MEKIVENLSKLRNNTAIISDQKHYSYQHVGVEILKYKRLYQSLPFRQRNTAIIFKESQKADAIVAMLALWLLDINTVLIPEHLVKHKIWRIKDVLLKNSISVIIADSSYVFEDTLVSVFINIESKEILYSTYEGRITSPSVYGAELYKNYDDAYIELYDIVPHFLGSPKISMLNPGVNERERESVLNLNQILAARNSASSSSLFEKEPTSLVVNDLDKMYVFVNAVLVVLHKGGKIVCSSSNNPYALIYLIKKHQVTHALLDTYTTVNIINSMIGNSRWFTRIKLWYYKAKYLSSLSNMIVYGEVNETKRKLFNRLKVNKTLAYCMTESAEILASKSGKTIKNTYLTPNVPLAITNASNIGEITFPTRFATLSYRDELYNSKDVGQMDKKGNIKVLGNSKSVIIDKSTNTVLDYDVIANVLIKYKQVGDAVVTEIDRKLYLFIDVDIDYCVNKNIYYPQVVESTTKILKEVNQKLKKILGVFQIERILILPQGIERISNKPQIRKYRQ